RSRAACDLSGRPGAGSPAGRGGRPHQGRGGRLAWCPTARLGGPPRASGTGTVRARSHPARVPGVALPPWRGYASALLPPLGHARVVVDRFHAVRLANTVVDQVRRRT